MSRKTWAQVARELHGGIPEDAMREAYNAGYHAGFYDGSCGDKLRYPDFEQWLEEVWDRRNDDDGNTPTPDQRSPEPTEPTK